MDSISLEELALLEILVDIDQSAMTVQTSALQARLFDAGLAQIEEGDLRLTEAGIERCKSLHHRIRADKEAADILKEREQSKDNAVGET